MEKPTEGVCVDASVVGADGNGMGIIEYRGVDIATGIEIFSYGRYKLATINVAEYLALVEGLMYLHWHGDYQTPIFSDSNVAIGWVTIDRSAYPYNLASIADNVQFLLWDATQWLIDEPVHQVHKWNTSEWGEIPADYGRKGKPATGTDSRSARRVKPREAAFGRVYPRMRG